MAWRRKARGRPRQAAAKRRAKTVRGRLPEEDRGTDELRRRKRRIAAGREDLEITSAAVLFAHAHLDRQQYDTLSAITQVLQRIARAWGGRDGSVEGLWRLVVGALIATGFAPAPTGVGGHSLADRARRQLQRVYRELDGSRDLVIELAEGRVPPVVLHVLERRLDHEDEDIFDRLRTGLDRIAGRR